MQTPKIISIPSKKLIGLNIKTSTANPKAKEVWSQLMPRRKEITNNVDHNLYSIQVYETGLNIETFNPQTIFTTWAAIEVTDFESIPVGLNSLDLEGGLYAVFQHKGAVSSFPKLAAYIFGTWIPESDYIVADRPHFEILGEKFLGPENPDSEEEVWVPIEKR